MSLILMFSVILSALSSCASVNPMTKRVASEVENELRVSQRGFRFYVSTDITLERLDFDITINPRETIIMEETRRIRISLSSNTPGRLQSFSINGAFNVAFESGPHLPTLSFVQNRGTGLNDRYYLNWVADWETGGWAVDPVSGRRVIIYENEAYLVDYRGSDEPFLQYRRTSRASTTTRRMQGLR